MAPSDSPAPAGPCAESPSAALCPAHAFTQQRLGHFRGLSKGTGAQASTRDLGHPELPVLGAPSLGPEITLRWFCMRPLSSTCTTPTLASPCPI